MRLFLDEVLKYIYNVSVMFLYPLNFRERSNRLKITFGLSILLHLTLALVFAAFVGLDDPSIAPVKRFIVEIFEQEDAQSEETSSEDSKRLAEKNRKIERESAPKNPAGASMTAAKKSNKPAMEEKKLPEEAAEKADIVEKQVQPMTAMLRQKDTEEPSARKLDLHPTYMESTISEGSPPVSSDVPEGNVISLDTMAFSDTGYFAQIRGKLGKNNYYPPAAKLSGLQGKVKLLFRLAADGRLLDVRVVGPSGFPILDEAAESTVKKAAPFGALPKSMGKTVNIEVTFEYALSYLYAR